MIKILYIPTGEFIRFNYFNSATTEVDFNQWWSRSKFKSPAHFVISLCQPQSKLWNELKLRNKIPYDCRCKEFLIQHD